MVPDWYRTTTHDMHSAAAVLTTCGGAASWQELILLHASEVPRIRFFDSFPSEYEADWQLAAYTQRNCILVVSLGSSLRGAFVT